MARYWLFKLEVLMTGMASPFDHFAVGSHQDLDVVGAKAGHLGSPWFGVRRFDVTSMPDGS